MTITHILIDTLSTVLNIFQAGIVWLLVSQNKRAYKLLTENTKFFLERYRDQSQENLTVINALINQKEKTNGHI